ncbi:MAG: response regulator transcription factor [Labilithrix sp.]|nr:response regulator transcription factor [Labilithrix sp.]MCW5810040.1 response regulator transcription factor [Labilithrix sp.]
MRSVIFRYESVAELSAALSGAGGSLALPQGEAVNDGEWVLAIFEIGSKKRATAAAARGTKGAAGMALTFERRDWDRLVGFVSARSEHMRASRPVSRPPVSSAKVPVAPPSAPPASVSDAPPRSRRLDDLPSTSALESSRVPFGARVLVVDSEGAAEEDLRAVLSEMGLVVELVATTALAEESLEDESFDAIVLDLRLPASDPRAFVGKVRANARIADIPVLFLSSKPTSRDVVDAFACGGDDFLPKPFRTTELAARIFGLLRRAHLARTAAGGT